MQQLFVQGFVCTLRLLAGLAGALAALAVVLLAAWLIVRALGRLAKLWNKTGYKPKTKWGRVIAAGGQTGGERKEKRDSEQLP